MNGGAKKQYFCLLGGMSADKLIYWLLQSQGLRLFFVAHRIQLCMCVCSRVCVYK